MTARLNGRTLPEGWIPTTFGDILHVVRGISFPKDAKIFSPSEGYIACLRTTNVQRNVEWDDLWFIPTEYVKRSEQFIQLFDILISTANSLELVGKVAQVNSIPYVATLGAFISLIRVPTYLNPKYIYFQLASSSVQDEIRRRASTTTNISNVSTQRLQDINLVLPPLNEQHRIVEAIETHFTRLDAAVTALKRSQANLKRYRAAVLKAACEGRLVPTEAELAQAEGRSYEPAAVLLERILTERRHKWEAENPKKKYQEPVAPDTSALPELPEGWCWAAPEQLSSFEKYALAIGPFGSNLLVSDYCDSGVPLVFVRNIRSGNFDLADSHFVTHAKATELAAHQVDGGDVLITKMGDPPGDACLYPLTKESAIITADCIKWRLSHMLDTREYFVHAIHAELVHRQILQETRGVAQKKISLARFKNIGVPLPPLAEQHRIVAEVELRLSLIDQLEKTIKTDLTRANRLRQSILKRAFAGQLVPQDPNDEPAAVLLERIQAAKQGQPVQKEFPLSL